MKYYAYHTEDEELLKQIDKEFNIVTLVGSPEDGYSDGYDLAIYDTRSKEQIRAEIQKIFNGRGRKA